MDRLHKTSPRLVGLKENIMGHEQDRLGKLYDRVFYAAVVGLTVVAVGFGFFCTGA